MTKIKLSVMMVSFLIISAVGIISYNINQHGLSEYQKIFDDLNKIVQDYDVYSYLIKKGQNAGNTSDLEFDFSGMDTIWKIKAQNDGVLHISYNSVINKGEFKVLLITAENKIITILKDSESGEKDIQILEGISQIKLIGRKASGNLKMILTANKWLEIIPINN